MKHIKILILLYLIFTGIELKAYSAQSANQIVSASIPQILMIEKIFVEAQEYHRDEPISNMRIRETRNVDDDNTILRLSPMRVQVRTNMGTPIIVYAEFKELKHKEGMYNFNKNNLMVYPSSFTINNPYDHVVSGVFTPFVDVIPNAAVGEYRGKITFTLGAI